MADPPPAMPMHDKHASQTPVIEAKNLSWSPSGVTVLDQLSLTLHPGLTLVRGGDGRGKTTLLRLMAGTLAPTSGVLRRASETVFHADMADPAHDPVVARVWLDAQRRRFPAWANRLATDLIDGFGLTDHIDKPLYMLSTGSRRKVGLLAAAASSAGLTLIDTPFAALDAASRQVLTELLTEAATRSDRAWVIADYAVPASLKDAAFSGIIDLGN